MEHTRWTSHKEQADQLTSYPKSGALVHRVGSLGFPGFLDLCQLEDVLTKVPSVHLKVAFISLLHGYDKRFVNMLNLKPTQREV